MSLILTPLYESMVRQFTTVVTDSKFQKDFVAAVNVVVDELSFDADLTTPIAHVDDYNATITELNAYHTFILNSGLVFALINSRQKHVRGDTAYDKAESDWDDKKGSYLVMEERDLQSTVDDDGVPTANIIGQGYKGDG